MITTNTDGNPISQAFADAMEQPSAMYSMKLYRNGTDLGAIIKGAKLDLGAGQSSDDLGTFAACGVYQTQFSASLYDCPSILGDELEVRVGVLTGNAYEYVAVAYVTITEESTWKGVTDVRGVGRMGLMYAQHGLADGDYQPAAIAAAIYAATGIPVSIDARLTTQSVHADAGGTCRDALESMCARLGAYACELGEGVSVMPYSSTATGTIPTGHVTGRPELGALYEVDGITVESESGELVQGTGRVRIADRTATATTAAATWGNMRGYAFTPATLNIALMDPRWTVADTLSVTLDGDAYAIPARGMSITYDGGYFGTVSAAGLTADAEDMIVEGPLTSRVESAYDLAAEAKAVAQAIGQHFWDDTNGAHVTEVTKEEWNDSSSPGYHSGHNSLWNSLGMLFRKGLDNLVSITQSAIAFFDGDGNEGTNIVASFGKSGAIVGKETASSIVIRPEYMVFNNDTGVDVGSIEPSSGTTAIARKYTVNNVGSGYILDGDSASFSINNVHPVQSTAILGYYQVSIYFYSEQSGTSFRWMFVLSGPNSQDIQYPRVYASVRTVDSVATFTFTNRDGGRIVINQAVVEWIENGSAPMFRFGDNEVFGEFAFAEGHGTTAYSFGHAEGYGAYAGQYSHAEGYGARASGTCSHAEGKETVASGSYQHVSGKYNVSSSSYAEIIGNGTADDARSNARTLDWNGNEVLAGGLTLGSPLTIANGGTGATTASGARVALNVPSVASQTNQSVGFSEGTGSGQVQLLGFNVTNSSHALSGKRLVLIICSDGIQLYNITDAAMLWSTVVTTSSPTLTNATATAFELRKSGSVVNLQINQLKVSASLADGSTVSLGTGIIPSESRPARAIGIPLVANAAGKGAGCWLYITGAGSVQLYNRSGSALATSTNLYGNATWVV